jgi:xanthine dehydrogenase YagR molybdenum-binding subunit
MAQTAWPGEDRRKVIGSRENRLDGPAKVTGHAKYTYDVNRDKLAYAKILQCPHAVAKITNVDTSEAEALPGVLGVILERDRQGNFPEITYQGDIVASLCAETEEIALDALHHIKVDYEIGTPQMNDKDPSLKSGRDQESEAGDVEKAFAEADAVVEGYYGLPAITHCCLEAHGQVCEFRDGELYVWPSTQNVSGYAGGLTREAETEVDKIHVDCQHMGGGFGAKFAADAWGIIGAKFAKMTGRPVKIMLERDMELRVAGHRPSSYGTVKVAVKNDGELTAFATECWGSGGQQRFRMPPLPYVFTAIPNYKLLGMGIMTNRGLTRAWRGPNHPQAALMTMCALDDAAAVLGMDFLEFLKRNLHLTEMPDIYAEQLDIAAEMIGYQDKWHPRGDQTPGPVKRGLGISIHRWGGQGHPSNCQVTINPDGSVIGRMGTQDLGTGTRTVVTTVLADSLGLELNQVRMEIGNNSYPTSGASGGSSTVGGVSAATRDAGVQALNALLDKVAPELNTTADKLEAWNGRIQEIGNPSNGMSWADACGLIGAMPITKQGSNPPADGTELTTGGVGGVQMADVSVDIETGVIHVNEYVSVQDTGLVINEKTADSQLLGGAIMGITYSLYEECVYDETTGAMLNPDMEFYRLATLADVGKIKTHLMRGPKYEGRGVIGIGEPAVLSAGAAISNAVANAIGLRVPELPLTPERVLDALTKGGQST